MLGEGELEQRARARVGSWLNDKYRLDVLLGVGGMAAVYKATHRSKAELAIKILHPEWCADAEVLRRFHREASGANSVKHPAVVRVLDDDMTPEGVAFLVMDLVDGAPLEDIWERYGRRLPLGPALNLLAQLLDVLAAAHAKGVIHRDIKPANLLVQRDGVLKVMDFGIARVRDAMRRVGVPADTFVTATGVILGTPAFMPPEQAMGDTKKVDARADLWSVGATLFTMLSGRAVHGELSELRHVLAAATTPAPSILEVVDDLHPEVARVIDRALAHDRDQRWESAAAMMAAADAASRAVFSCSAAELEPLLPPPIEDAALAPTQRASDPKLLASETVSETEHAAASTLSLGSTAIPVAAAGEVSVESDMDGASAPLSMTQPSTGETPVAQSAKLSSAAADADVEPRSSRRALETAPTEIQDRASLPIAAAGTGDAPTRTARLESTARLPSESPAVPDSDGVRVLRKPSLGQMRSDPPPSPEEWADARAKAIGSTDARDHSSGRLALRDGHEVGVRASAPEPAEALAIESAQSTRDGRRVVLLLASIFAVVALVVLGLRPRDATTKPAEVAPRTYSVRAAPPDAEIFVDGTYVATGTLTATLPTDARAHVLVVTARGHEPATFRFDAREPPPVLIELHAIAPGAATAPPGPSLPDNPY